MVEVRDAPERERYEIEEGGAVAGFAQYRDRPGSRALVHTEVDPAASGRGLGGRLVAGALADARVRGLLVVPVCSFVRGWLAEHPDELDLVEPRVRRSFDLPDPPAAP